MSDQTFDVGWANANEWVFSMDAKARADLDCLGDPKAHQAALLIAYTAGYVKARRIEASASN